MDTKKAGQLGGRKRAANMTPDQRRASARAAAKARWAGHQRKAIQTDPVSTPKS